MIYNNLKEKTWYYVNNISVFLFFLCHFLQMYTGSSIFLVFNMFIIPVYLMQRIQYTRDNVNQAILWFAPNAMTVITIIFYQYVFNKSNGTIELSSVFSILNVIKQINKPVREIPNDLGILYDTIISMKRIGHFLVSSEESFSDSHYSESELSV